MEGDRVFIDYPATGPGTTHYDGPPPAKYARDTVAVVLFTDLNGVKRECGEAPPPLTRMGCAGVRPDGVKIAILLHPSFMPSNPYAVYINHELAHLNGWPGTHPL